MTNEEWTDIIETICELWPRWDKTKTRAQVLRVMYDRYPYKVVKACILTQFSQSDDQYNPKIKTIHNRIRRAVRASEIKKRLGLSNQQPRLLPVTPCAAVDEPTKMRITADTSPDAFKIPNPTQKQVREANIKRQQFIAALKTDRK